METTEKASKERQVIKPMELIERVKAENPKLLAGLSEKQANRFVRKALGEIGSNLAAMDQGILRVQGLGRFNVRQVEREKDGEKVTLKRVDFTPESREEAETTDED